MCLPGKTGNLLSHAQHCLLDCSRLVHRTTEKEERDRIEKARWERAARGSKGMLVEVPVGNLMHVVFSAGEKGSGQEGYPQAEEGQAWGSYKAERLLYFTSRAMAVANWADLEALLDFYESMLEAGKHMFAASGPCFAQIGLRSWGPGGGAAGARWLEEFGGPVPCLRSSGRPRRMAFLAPAWKTCGAVSRPHSGRFSKQYSRPNAE